MYELNFNYDQELTFAQKDQVELALRALNEVFSFRKSIPVEDKARMHSLGKSNVDWVQKCLIYAKDNPNFLSRDMSYDEFLLYYQSRALFMEYLSRLVPFVQDLKDTVDYLGHLSMTYGLDYYDGVKGGLGRKRMGSKPIYDDLSQRFASQGPGKATANAANAADENGSSTTGDQEKTESEEVAPQEQLTLLAESLAREMEIQNENNAKEGKKEGGVNEE